MRLSAILLVLALAAGSLVAAGAGRGDLPAGSRTGAEAEPAVGREPHALPWLHNFTVRAAASEATRGVADRMARWREPDPSCSAVAYGGLAITADVAEAAGSEEVLASFTQGVLVIGAGERLVASATALPCQGSADEIDAIAAGDAQIDRPVIALAVTTGGHRASSTWLVLYGVAGGVVAPLFAASVETHEGDRTRTGEVTILPGALLYRAPSGVQTMWVYSAEQQRYVELALVMPPG